MILDLKAHPEDADRYEVFDKSNGENIGRKLGIFYANDEVGIIRYFVEDSEGMIMVNPSDKSSVTASVIIGIEIRPKEGFDYGERSEHLHLGHGAETVPRQAG